MSIVCIETNELFTVEKFDNNLLYYHNSRARGFCDVRFIHDLFKFEGVKM